MHIRPRVHLQSASVAEWNSKVAVRKERGGGRKIPLASTLLGEQVREKENAV